MSATDPVITLVTLVKLEFPAGDVRLCDGGMATYSSETYAAHHAVFGSLVSIESFDAGFGDAAESGTLVLAPNPDATLTDWWRTDLGGCRVRIWLGEPGADLYTVSSATLLADLLVDSVERLQAEGGRDLLSLELMGRPEKLFLANEGNVCSGRFHKSVWPAAAATEKGFDNCTGLIGFLAWGAAAPARSSQGGSI